MTVEQGLWDKLDSQVTRRKIYGLMIVLALIPLFFPISLPMTLSYTTTDLLNTINALPPKSIVAYAYHTSGLPGPRENRLQAFLSYLCKRDLRMIVYCFLPPAPVAFDIKMKQYVEAEKKYGYKYGQDWVLFPFLGGDEAAVAAIGANLRYFDKDYYGNQIDSLPIMQGLHTLKDVPLCTFEVGEITFCAAIVRQWPAAYGVKSVYPGAFSNIATYYGKFVFGCIDGERGLQEFEYATGYQGEALMRAGMRSMLIPTMFGLIILGNIIEYGKKTHRLKLVQRGAE